MSDFRRLTNVFRCVVNPHNKLVMTKTLDADLWFYTQPDDGMMNTQVRLRAYNDGGCNMGLFNILAPMLGNDRADFRQPDMFETFYAAAAPNDYVDYRFRCDDNPGSHIRLAVADTMFALQTNCHDIEADYRAGGGAFSTQGDGPMVWIARDMYPRIYEDIQKYILRGEAYKGDLYGDHAFRPYVPTPEYGVQPS